jgi:hypothetical protein
MMDRDSSASTRRTIVRLVGVYNANGTLGGELAYFVGARLGRTHCALCDITHGLVSERPAWKACRAALAVPFDTYHRNDQPDEVAAVSGGVAPVVSVETIDGMSGLLGPDELQACAGSIDRFSQAMHDAVAARGLRWPD